ncbi:MAG: MFS transporter [Clostridiales bacterium]|jgi:Na+/melibiose symporter-like transporter|nr:MFS transporter [Clostridiales bacterium]
MKLDIGTIKRKTSDFLTDFREYWTKPPKGKYISYKEIGAYSLGGVGKMLIGMLTSYIGLSATNTLVGSVIQIRPLDLQNMNFLLSFLGLGFTVLRGIIVDNTQTKWGRFRPYIAFMGVPMVFLMIIFLGFDFQSMVYGEKVLWCMLFNIALVLISPLLNDTYTELRTVMSPNSQERALLITVSTLIASAAPTITNLFVPSLVYQFGGYTNITAYRAIFIPIGIIGLFFMFFTAFGTKERVFVSKQYKPKIRTLHAIRQIYRNKYWLIRSIAGWTGFLEGGIASLYWWIFVYQVQNGAIQSGVLLFTGFASTVAMLITPSILKKLGPRKFMIWQNFFNIVFVGLMALTFQISPWGVPVFFFLFNFLSTVVYELNIVGDPVIHAEVKDFSHYQSGRRMDFMFGTAGIIGFPITIITGYVLPLIYQSGGLTDNYDVLFDPAIRNSLFGTICLVSVLGSAINLVPYFFYDLSESQHKNIIKVLRLRNMFEDYAGKTLSPRDIKMCVEEVREAREHIGKNKADVAPLVLAVKNAKKLPYKTDAEKEAKKAAVKTAKNELASARQINENIAAAHIVINELKKYGGGIEAKRLELAKATLALGFDGIKNLGENIVAEAKAAPKGATEEERNFKHYKVRRAKLLLVLKKAIIEKGLQPMDTSELDAANAMPENNRQEILQKFKAVGAAQKKLNKYNLAAEAYMDAERVVADAEAYSRFSEIEAGYEDACAAVEALDLAEKEKAEAAKKAKQDDLERIRRKRREKREARKVKKGGGK